MSPFSLCSWLMIVIYISLPQTEAANETCLYTKEMVFQTDLEEVTWVPLHQNRLEFSMKVELTFNSFKIRLAPDAFGIGGQHYPRALFYVGFGSDGGNPPTPTGIGNYVFAEIQNSSDFSVFESVQGVGLPTENTFTDYYIEITDFYMALGYQGQGAFLNLSRPAYIDDEDWPFDHLRQIYRISLENKASSDEEFELNICHIDNAATGKQLHATPCNITLPPSDDNDDDAFCLDEAFDGDITTCMLTALSDSEVEFVTIDLGETHYITAVSIYNFGVSDYISGLGAPTPAQPYASSSVATNRVYISDCPLRDISSVDSIAANASECGDGFQIEPLVPKLMECINGRTGRYVHVVNEDFMSACEIVVHGDPIGDMGPKYYQGDYVEPEDNDMNGVPDKCEPSKYSASVHKIKGFFGGMVGRIIVDVEELAEDWRVEVNFRRNVFKLELMDCDAKLADVEDNGKDKKHFILDAAHDEFQTLQPGRKLVIEFIAKTFKRARDVKFDATFYPNYFDDLKI